MTKLFPCQIRDIFRSSGMNRERYRKAIDQTMFYLKSLGVPPQLQGRVMMWFNFNWLNSKTLGKVLAYYMCNIYRCLKYQ